MGDRRVLEDSASREREIPLVVLAPTGPVRAWQPLSAAAASEHTWRVP